MGCIFISQTTNPTWYNKSKGIFVVDIPLLFLIYFDSVKIVVFINGDYILK